ncbi:MAG: hypothetical protein ACRDTT_31700 [Pseudonocardiaceae bacterium]
MGGWVGWLPDRVAESDRPGQLSWLGGLSRLSRCSSAIARASGLAVPSVQLGGCEDVKACRHPQSDLVDASATLRQMVGIMLHNVASGELPGKAERQQVGHLKLPTPH